VYDISMNNSLKYLSLSVIIIVFTSCSVIRYKINPYYESQRTKTLRLKEFDDTINIGFETNNAIIYVGKNDLIKILNLELESEVDEILQQFLIYLKGSDQSLFFSELDDEYTNEKFHLFHAALRWELLYMAIENKFVKIFNKGNNTFETKINRVKYRESMGGVGVYYTFKDSEEIFFDHIIRLG